MEKINISPRAASLNMNKYEIYCNQIKSELTENLTLEYFKDKIFCQTLSQKCSELFFHEIEEINRLLHNEEIAISYLDIPESPLYDKQLNTIFGVALSLGIFNQIGLANVDPINHVPFTLHTASHTNSKKLNASNIEAYTPEIKLGFHNDGLISSDKIELPHHIGLYNLFINYKKPGNFLWIPTALWREADFFWKTGKILNNFTLKLTPIVHLNDQNMPENYGLDVIRVPVVCGYSEQKPLFFLNGEVLLEKNSDEQIDFISNMRQSLQQNPQRIVIPQKERRLIILKNSAGFHARDVFEEPDTKIDLTRVLLRMVDTNLNPSFPFKMEYTK